MAKRKSPETDRTPTPISRRREGASAKRKPSRRGETIAPSLSRYVGRLQRDIPDDAQRAEVERALLELGRSGTAGGLVLGERMRMAEVAPAGSDIGELDTLVASLAKLMQTSPVMIMTTHREAWESYDLALVDLARIEA